MKVDERPADKQADVSLRTRARSRANSGLSNKTPNESKCCGMFAGCVNRQLLASTSPQQLYRVICQGCIYSLFHCSKVAKKQTSHQKKERRENQLVLLEAFERRRHFSGEATVLIRKVFPHRNSIPLIMTTQTANGCFKGSRQLCTLCCWLSLRRLIQFLMSVSSAYLKWDS